MLVFRTVYVNSNFPTRFLRNMLNVKSVVYHFGANFLLFQNHLRLFLINLLVRGATAATSDVDTTLALKELNFTQ